MLKYYTGYLLINQLYSISCILFWFVFSSICRNTLTNVLYYFSIFISSSLLIFRRLSLSHPFLLLLHPQPTQSNALLSAINSICFLPSSTYHLLTYVILLCKCVCCMCVCLYVSLCVFVSLWVCFEEPFILGIDFGLLLL